MSRFFDFLSIFKHKDLLFFNFLKTDFYEKNDIAYLPTMTFASSHLGSKDLCNESYTETFSENAGGCNCAGNTITLTGTIDGDNFLQQFVTFSTPTYRQLSIPNNICINIDGILIISPTVTVEILTGIFNMSPGSEVRVRSGGGLTLSGNITFQGCEGMWRGIYFEDDARLGVESGVKHISDALCGLAFNSPHFAPIKTFHFDRNFIGVYAHGNDDPIGQNNNAFDYRIWDCIFDCSGPLLPNNTTIPADFNFINLPDLPTTDGWAYTGIIARDLERLPVGPTASEINTTNDPQRNLFMNLSNGIIAQRDVTSVEVDGFLIQNLVPDRYEFDSHGIFVRRGNTLFVRGDGATDMATGIENCKRAVFTDNTPIIFVSDTRMEDTREGVRSEFIEQGTFDIRNNNISGFRNGIYLGNSDVLKMVVIDNTISITDEFEKQIAGINFQLVDGVLDIVTGSTDSEVARNTITLTDTKQQAYGVFASETEEILFLDNTILLDNQEATGRNWVDFYLTKARDLHIITNQVDATSPDFGNIGAEKRSYGMDIVKSDGTRIINSEGVFFGNLYECNDFDQTTKGIRFNGDCQNTQLVTNVFNDHHTALDYKASAVTGVQENNGNTWTNQMITWGADHESDDFTVLNESRFLIHENCMTNPNTIFWPCNIQMGSGNIGDWFNLDDLPATPACPENYTPHSPNPEQPVSGCNDAFEQAIMNYQSTGNGFSDYLGWDLQRSLYRKIVENQQENDPCYQSFYNAVNNGSLGNTEDYRAATDYQPSASQATQFANLNDNIVELRETIAAITLVIANTENPEELEQLESQQDNKISTLNGEIATRQNLLTSYLTARNAAIAAQSGNNQSTQAENLFESNEKIINTIAESTIMIGNKDLTSTEITEVIQIAKLCPLVGGPRAVFTARSILSLLNIDQEYPTDCTTATKKEDQNQIIDEKDLNTSFSILPNPATTDLTIRYQFSESADRDLEIYNALGTQVYSQTFNDKEGQITLPINNLAPGIYYCTIKQKGSLIQSEKLIIQR